MGCGSSFRILPSPNHNNKPSNSKPTSNITKGKLPPIHSEQKSTKNRDKNLEPLTLICLDEHFDENDKQLRSIIDYVRCFNDLDTCEEFIQNIDQNNFIFFIVSSEDFTNIISHIHELSQILAIYVFQDNRKSNIDKHWTKRYSKVTGKKKQEFYSFFRIKNKFRIRGFKSLCNYRFIIRCIVFES
jgi:hypothetical protein